MISWLILLAPLVSAILILFGFHRSKSLSQVISVSACLISLGVAIGFNTGALTAPESLTWIDLPGFKAEIGILLDPLSKLMLLVVTGVGLMVHLFSIGYMHEDESVSRFFGKLSIFMFSMIGIVVATNLVQMFIFWELVGLSSYLLIGFWFQKPSAADAAKKAFLVNRVGDFGFLLGIILYWTMAGTVVFGGEAVVAIQSHIGERIPYINVTLVTAMGVLLFCGCMGKSAMVPLHVWLPDAMEGPTPVSALIHAATMVAAGVYMLCRLFIVLSISSQTLMVIMTVGVVTAFFAALIATQQNDIKRILAYSTLSQLGYMVMAVGLTSPGVIFPGASMFHLTTHAFFKAMLFLGAGSVIHAVHHEQDIWKMGGLWKKLPITFWTFLLGVLALSGCPFTSGFFSKEEILNLAYHRSGPAMVFASLTAFLTSFYMMRLVVVAFFGDARSSEAAKAHESPWIMTLPLIILAIFTVISGYPSFGVLSSLGPVHEHDHESSNTVMLISLAAMAFGYLFAIIRYKDQGSEPMYCKALARKFYVDEFYDGVLLRLQQWFAIAMDFVDQWVIGFFCVRGTSLVVNLTGEVLRLIQSGSLQCYSFFFGAGVVGLVYWMLKGF
ncbi:MAG: NADH-quinone oxidoreductase subunit L [Verrucomicrobiota bacterium]